MQETPAPSRRPLPRRVWLLSWVSLFADVASEMAYPIIPYFIKVVLKAPAVALGGIEGFAEALVSFMKGWSGWHSDQRGERVPYIRLGYGLSALGKPILGLAFAWPIVFLGRTLDRFGKGLRTTARDALLADSVDKSQYGQAFGLHRAMDTTGAFLGGVLAIVLLATLPGGLGHTLRLIFLIAFVPGLISVLFTFLLKESRQAPATGERTTARARLSAMPRAYWRAVVITLLFGLANSSDTFLLLRAQNLFGDSIKQNPRQYDWFFSHFGQAVVVLSGPLIMATLAYLLYNATYVAFSYPAGVVSDRIGRWKVITVGYILYALVYAGFGYTSTGGLWLLFALYGVYIGLADGVGKALVADHSPPESRGTALGFFYMGSGMMTLLGNVIAGLLWDQFGPRSTFLFGSVIAILTVLLIPLTAGMSRGEGAGRRQ